MQNRVLGPSNVNDSLDMLVKFIMLQNSRAHMGTNYIVQSSQMYSLAVSARAKNERLPWDVDRYITIFWTGSCLPLAAILVRLGVKAGLSYSSNPRCAADCRGSTAACRIHRIHEPEDASHILHPLLGMRITVVRL